jgi:hypothetical protein
MKLGEHGAWRRHKVLLILISLVVVVGAPVCLYLARERIVPVVSFWSFGGRFEWDRAGGFKSFTMGSPFGGAKGEKLWVYLVTAQVKPILDRKLRRGPWQKATGQVWLKVAGVIPLVWPDSWGPYCEDPNGFFVDNYTPLMLAAEEGDMDSVRKLLAGGADVTAKDFDGRTALSHAFRHTRRGEALVPVLLAAGADPNAADHQGQTPLYYAAFQSTTVIQQLLGAGARVNAADKWGETALMEAAGQGAVENLRALVAAGADVNMKDESGRTALMEAAEAGSLDALRVLLAAGAGVNMRDRSGETALSMAERKGYLKAADLLKAAGAKQ